MKQTPIQKAIDKLTETHGMIISTSRYAEGFAEGLSGALEELKQLLPYEEETIIGFADKLLEMPNRELESFTTKEHFNQNFKK